MLGYLPPLISSAYTISIPPKERYSRYVCTIICFVYGINNTYLLLFLMGICILKKKTDNMCGHCCRPTKCLRGNKCFYLSLRYSPWQSGRRDAFHRRFDDSILVLYPVLQAVRIVMISLTDFTEVRRNKCIYFNSSDSWNTKSPTELFFFQPNETSCLVIIGMSLPGSSSVPGVRIWTLLCSNPWNLHLPKCQQSKAA